MSIKDQEWLIESLEAGGVILCPTDTIRGLSCDATNSTAVEKIFEIKQRPKEKSVIVLMAWEEMLAEHGVELNGMQKEFLEAAQKPTTIILDGVQWLAPEVYHANGSVGVRIVRDREDNPWAHWVHELMVAYGKPLVSTSANISGDSSPRLFHEISEEIVTQVDGYPEPEITKTVGQSSKIVRIDTDGAVHILRE